MGFAHQRPDGTMVALPATARASVGAPLLAGAGDGACVSLAGSGTLDAIVAVAASGAVSAADPGAAASAAPEGSLFKLVSIVF